LDEAQALLQRNSVLDESRKSFSKGLPKHFNSDEGEQVMATPTVWAKRPRILTEKLVG